MPNKFARAIPVADYTPRGLLPDGLLPVARPDGSFENEIAGVTNRLANTFGAIADEAAVAEGASAGKKAGLSEDYRPTGSSTLRGRSFDEAATRTYADKLDATVRTDMQKVFEANRNDPAALAKGFDALHSEYGKKHVFDEMRGAFDASFSRLRMPYQNKALGNFDELTRDQGRASGIDALTSIQTNAARMASVDPNNPQTAKTIELDIARADRIIDGNVATEAWSAETGAKLKIKQRNDITARAAIGQAEVLTSSDEVATYRANVRRKFAAGEFKNLTAEGFDDLDARLEQMERAKRTGASAGATQLEKNLTDYVQRAADGFPIGEDEWTRHATSPAALTEKGKASLNLAQGKLQVAQLLRNKSVEDGEVLVSRLRSEATKGGATTEGQADIVRFAEKLVKDQRTALNTDQLGLAERKRIVAAIAPLDFQGFATSDNPAAAGELAAQVRARTSQARAIGTELQRAPQFLRPEERERLKDIVDRGGAKALALAGAIVKGADTDAPAVLREISGDAPLLAQAGSIIANGGSLSAARDAFEAARIKTETGKELPGVAPTISQKAQRDAFGTAFSRQGEDASRIRTTADAIARTRVAREGVDPKGSAAEKIYSRALQEAAGATFVDGVQYGGVADYKPPANWFGTSKVVVPAGMRADAFRDVVRAFRDDDLATLPVPPQYANGQPVPAREIAQATPVAVRGGYRFALGDPTSDDPKFIRGADGNPFLLGADRIQQMMPRVPGAFLGAR